MWPGRRPTTLAWTGDAAFLAEGGRDLLIDTARYWASRIRTDADGDGHLYGVMGPDEYHQVVDDNAYTNVMARWNLRQGADLLSQSGDTAYRGDVAGTGRRTGRRMEPGARASTSSSPATSSWSHS